MTPNQPTPLTPATPPISTECLEGLPELFGRAYDLDPPAQQRYLELLANVSPELARELGELLAAAPKAQERFAASALDRQENDEEPDFPERLGPFHLLREIGRGGMGRVFLAEEERDAFRRRVALKLVDHPWIAPQKVRRMREEIRILATLEHPGIARFLDGGALADGTWFLALEYVEGVDLTSFCQRENLDARSRLRLFREVVKAVAYAHERGVVHRDLKPANILVDSEGRPRLLDFGIAKLLESDTDEATTAGRSFTPAYASPEQFLGEAVGPASDVYSLGVILYLLVVGERPHQAAEAHRTTLGQVIVHQAPEPPSRASHARRAAGRSETTENLSGSWARDLDAVVLKMLRRDPAERYADAGALAEDLELFLADQPVKARRMGAVDSLRTFGRRRPLLLGLALATLLVAGVSWFLLTLQGVRDLPPAPVARPNASEIGELSARFAAAPDRPELGLDLVKAQLARGRGEEAMTTVSRLRQMGAAGALAPRVDLAEAEAALAVSEFQRASRLAQTVLDAATKSGDAQLVLSARLAQAEALLRLMPPEAVETLLEALHRDAHAAGASEIAARALLVRARASRRGARAQEAAILVEEALHLFRAQGNRAREAEALIWRARLEGESGALDQALVSIEEALQLARSIDHLEREGAALATKGALLNWKGDDVGGEKAVLEAVQRLRLAGDREQLLTQLTNLALSRIEQSAFGDATTLISEAETIARLIGNPLQRSSVLRARGYLEESRGFYDEARTSYEGAAQAAREAGAREPLATYLSALAWLEANAERFESAATAAREAADLFRQGGDERSALHVECALAWAEALGGQTAMAERRLLKIEKSASDMGSESLNYAILLIRSELAELRNDWPVAVQLRRKTSEMAAGFGSPGLVLSQKVQLAQALARAGDREAARTLARELLPEAERRDRTDIVRECREFLASEVGDPELGAVDRTGPKSQ